MNSSNAENVNSEVRSSVLRILVKYDESHVSLRSLLRIYRNASSHRQSVYSQIQYLSISIIKHLNTIDFLISRSIKKDSFRHLSLHTRALLRLSVFLFHWHGCSSESIFRSLSHDDHLIMPVLQKSFSKDLETILQSRPKIEQLSLRYSHPSFLVETLLANMTESEAISLMRSNNVDAITYLRMNRLLLSSNMVLDHLSSIGVELEPEEGFSALYRVKSGLDTLVQSEPFLKNQVLIQDKASIQTIKVLSPKPHEFVWDACAAPGMKTQLIWEMMNGQGRLVATELSARRLDQAKARSLILGLERVEWLHADASTCPIGGANKILIDAPCTATGMLRSHPSFKWRLNKNTLFSIMAIQNKILEGVVSHYSGLPGTEIVYSTCSLLPHEGESQIDTVLTKFNIELLDIPEILHKGYPGFECSTKVRRLYPHIDATDGFFVAKMRITQ